MKYNLPLVFTILATTLAAGCTPASQVAQTSLRPTTSVVKPHSAAPVEEHSSEAKGFMAFAGAPEIKVTVDTAMQTEPSSPQNKLPKNLDELWSQFTQRQSEEGERSKPNSNTDTIAIAQPVSLPSTQTQTFTSPVLRTANTQPSVTQSSAASAPTSRGEMITVVISGDKALMYGEEGQARFQEALAAIQRGEHVAVTLEDPLDLPVSDFPEEKVEEESLEEEFDNPNDMLLHLMEQRVADKPTPKPSYEVTALSIPGNQSVVIDENLLIQWENAIAARKKGVYSPTTLPAWVMQGLEWLTHAPKEEPVRSQTLMPLYRRMESSGLFADVKVNSLTPEQVVGKLRLFVDEMKREKKNW
ncbi:MAG: hypothetical protein SF052_10260 [Bacteroidia bacterium]|nr:hypothetical protein [Bacteroidia bacterium]